jgi:ATP-dependent Clp protease ATP-binding subunit ClpC
MFERFTPRARHVVVQAQEEARTLQHNYIGTEHLLLGMFGEPDSIGARVLIGFGFTREHVRDAVLAEVGPGQSRMEGHIPFTPRAKKVLEYALREALELQHNYIGTEHIVLGLLREGDGVGAKIIRSRVPEPATARVRVAVLDLLPTPKRDARRRWLRRTVTSSADPPVAPQPEALDTTPAADAALQEAAQLAGAQPVGSQHLMLAALADPNSAAARALTELGVDLDRARDTLRGVDVVDTSDESPEDAGRRHMLVRITDERVVVEATDPALVQLGKSVLAALGDELEEPEIMGEHAFAASVADLWRAIRDSLDDMLRRIAIARAVPEVPQVPEAPDSPDKT